MVQNKRWFLVALLVALLCSVAGGVGAQGESSGTLVLGQPAVSQIATAGQTFNYDYTITEPRQISLQALGDGAQPTITILQNGTVVAEQTNAGSALTIALDALLNAGSYVVQVGALNNTTGLVVLVLQSETAVTAATLSPGAPLSGSVSAAAPLALYSFNALGEPAFLYIESGLPTSGVNIRLVEASTGALNGMINASLTGARFRIPAGNAAYQVEVESSGAATDEPFTLCLAAVSTGGCEAGSAQQPQATQEIIAIAPPAQNCTVSSSTGSPVNIRQSASTAAIIVASLPVGSSADVIGISPDSSFYNVLFSGTNGWVALSVVNTSGNCADILVINPPAVVAPPTLSPAQPTPIPVQPTQPPPPTPFGPCLITLTAPTYIYQIPNADVSNLQDQVQMGELIPTGRLADNSWWKTNYGGAWIQTSTFGASAQVSGDCRNLPLVTP